MNVGVVGSPLACCDVKLVSWEEGSYRVTDRPLPRGEIHLGGDNVSMGYYKNPEKTQEEFYQSLDPEGGVRRWFKTGDIGEMLPEGIVRIIGGDCCVLFFLSLKGKKGMRKEGFP